MNSLKDFDRDIRNILDELKQLDKQLKDLWNFRKEMLFNYNNEGITISAKNKSIMLNLDEIGLEKLLESQIRIYEDNYTYYLNRLQSLTQESYFDNEYEKLKDEILDLSQIPRELRLKMKEVM